MRWNLRHLSYVVSAADSGSIVRASTQVGVSQAAVSAAINNIEEQFRLRIFVRQPGRGLSLTPTGGKFVARSRELLTQVNAFESGAASLSEQLSGTLEVACFFPSASFVMPPIIKAIAFRYPAISVNLREADLYETSQAVTDGDVDVALTYDIYLNDRMEFEPLLEVPLYALFSPNDPLADCEAISLTDLARAPLVMLDLPGSRERFFDVFSLYGLVPRIAFRTRSYEMVRSFVAAGLGYSLLGFKSATNSAHDGTELSCRPIKEDLPFPYFGLAFPKPSIKNRVVEVFAEECRRVIGELDATAQLVMSGTGSSS